MDKDKSEQARKAYERKNTPINQRYTDEELSVLVVKLLKERSTGMTYNQVATVFNVVYAKASGVLKALAADERSPVATEIVSRGEKKHTLYIYAPIRKEIKAAPANIDKIIQREVLALLWDHDLQSESAIRQHIIGMLRVGVEAIRRNLKLLRDTGQVTTQPGPRRAVLYSLP